MKMLLVLAIALLTFSTAFAASPQPGKHWEVYGKTGSFSWVEWYNGKEFIRDDGTIQAMGITRTDALNKKLLLSETFELWGGSPAYDGEFFATEKELLVADNKYEGRREEIRATLQFPLEKLTLNPFASIEHKCWSREVEREFWDMAYSRIGIKISQIDLSANTSMHISGGKTLPFYTKNYFNVSSSTDYADVILRPKARPGTFWEIMLKVYSWDIGLSYEKTVFDLSDGVETPRIKNITVSAPKTTFFYQPKSITATTWLKIGYNF